MPFYELVCIARHNMLEGNLKDLLKTSAKHVVSRGGVVRGFDNWGEMKIPHRIKRHQEYHTDGRYWTMHFYANPLILQDLGKQLSVDSRVLRHTFIKLGEKLEDVVERPDKV
ncbi:30S ribosomal protein S6 [Mycotypha africana]|uniref:30S ribosomal protein S6 n=1 Tax=Mycotypha africana TaxID=64632 RepID=UPI0023012B63|nr:30S ribosomal protein S6 [Mycotypha africana]KAI8971682.1 30S ribosomal protein S6 [Mycotypha africana]